MWKIFGNTTWNTVSPIEQTNKRVYLNNVMYKTRTPTEMETLPLVWASQ